MSSFRNQVGHFDEGGRGKKKWKRGEAYKEAGTWPPVLLATKLTGKLIRGRRVVVYDNIKVLLQKKENKSHDNSDSLLKAQKKRGK